MTATKYNTPTPHIETISPAAAKIILEGGNDENRPLSPKLVERYAGTMRRGKWMLNGESIIISSEGRVLDGQHRLHACIRANLPFQTVVVRGVADPAFTTIDQGKSRNAGDALSIRGEKDVNVLAGGIRTACYLQRGSQTHSEGIPTDEVLEFFEQNRAITAWIPYVRPCHRFLPSALALGLAYTFAAGGKNTDKVIEFFTKLASGAGLGEGSSILLLRNRLITIRDDQKHRLARPETVSLVIVAWNAFFTNRPLFVLKRHGTDVPKIVI